MAHENTDDPLETQFANFIIEALGGAASGARRLGGEALERGLDIGGDVASFLGQQFTPGTPESIRTGLRGGPGLPASVRGVLGQDTGPIGGAFGGPQDAVAANIDEGTVIDPGGITVPAEVDGRAVEAEIVNDPQFQLEAEALNQASGLVQGLLSQQRGTRPRDIFVGRGEDLFRGTVEGEAERFEQTRGSVSKTPALTFNGETGEGEGAIEREIKQILGRMKLIAPRAAAGKKESIRELKILEQRELSLRRSQRQEQIGREETQATKERTLKATAAVFESLEGKPGVGREQFRALIDLIRAQNEALGTDIAIPQIPEREFGPAEGLFEPIGLLGLGPVDPLSAITFGPAAILENLGIKTNVFSGRAPEFKEVLAEAERSIEGRTQKETRASRQAFERFKQVLAARGVNVQGLTNKEIRELLTGG